MPAEHSKTVDTEVIHSFERPPLVETVMGVQFKRLPKLTTPFLALFWASLGDDWTNVEEVAAQVPQYERFDDERSWGQLAQISFRVSDVPEIRYRISNSRRTRMIQVQNGAIHYNWLGSGGQDYPRYAVVRPEFEDIVQRFSSFLDKRSIGTIEMDQWEITYVDHFPKGTVWNSKEDWSRLLHGASVPYSIAEGLALDTVFLKSSYEIASRRGRLHIQVLHGQTQNPKANSRTEMLRVDLTARGPIDKQTSMVEGLNLGRNAIVKAFFNLTSQEAHDYWGYKHGG